MAMQWCTKLEVAWNRCPIVLRGHPSNFKVTWARKKQRFWIQFEQHHWAVHSYHIPQICLVLTEFSQTYIEFSAWMNDYLQINLWDTMTYSLQLGRMIISWWACYCPACRTTFIATRFRVAVICPIIPVPHCIRVFFYFVWFVFINHIFQFNYELCTYCNILDIYLS